MSSVPICLIAFLFLFSFIFQKFNSISTHTLAKFRNSLNANQKDIYKDIINERRSVFTNSIIISLLLALMSTIWLYDDKSLHTKLCDLVCYFISLTLFSTYVIYNLYPKTKWMLNYLTNQEQITNWLAIYKSFKQSNYLGMIFGILVYYTYSHFTINKHK